MSKIEMTIAPTYVPHWGVWEGLRELVANALDGTSPKVTLTQSGNLHISNTDTVLPKEALLIGTSTKTDGTTIGQHGEGLKLGVLALVRQNIRVYLRNGDELWEPKLEQSRKFNSQVLVFNTRKASPNHERTFEVVVKGVAESWRQFKNRFLDGSEKKITTHAGDLLLDKVYKGMLFVKGVYIQEIPKLSYGYNFRGADVNRDRSIISNFDINWHCSQILACAGLEATVMTELLSKSNNQEETTYLSDYCPTETVQSMAALFAASYGEKAYPVESQDKVKELEFYGRRGIVVPAALSKTLQRYMGTIEMVKATAAEDQIKTVQYAELNSQEQMVYDKYTALFSEFKLPTIVTFGNPDLMGRFLHQDGQVQIARRLLTDPVQFVATMAHEYAHVDGGDGSKSHEDEANRLLATIVVRNLK